ncbi:MAG TPA: TlpA disulfide reductase family protein [Noviherbaspirillum sp.]
MMTIRRRLACALLALATTLPAVAAENGQPTQIQAEMLDGGQFSLSSSRGATTVLSIWSPESLASRKCIWELQRFASMYETRGVRTIAISTLNDRDELRLFLKSRKLSLPVAMLGDNDLGRIDELRLPLVYVFDQDGKLQASHAGLFSLRTLQRLVDPQLRQ